MSFSYPSIALLGIGLALLPMMVHLISRRRRQRVEWAAMDFLLESNKKNHNRSRIEEWLLLLLRILAVALAGIMAAVPQLPDTLSEWFEGTPAVHLVVLDDSYSMTKVGESETPWRLANEAIERLLKRSQNSGSPLQLVRYSDPTTSRKPGLINDPTNDSISFDTKQLKCMELATEPAAALLQVQQLIEKQGLAESRCFLTILSDFQRNTHANNEAFVSAIESIADKVDGIVLAPCANAADATINLTLSDLTIEPGPRAVGVEAVGQVRVSSYNQSTVAKTAVDIFQEQRLLTSVEVGPFAPFETLEVTFPMLIAQSGPKVIEAKLPGDSLAADNERRMVLDLPKTRSVLLVEGDKQESESTAFAAAFAPQASLQTGWQTRVVKSKNLDSLGDLSATAVICLLDVPPLGSQAIRELGTYVQQGGGVLNVLGPQTDRAFYNNLTAEATNSSTNFTLLPMRLDLPTQAPWSEPGETMIRVEKHPALRILRGQRNGFLPLIRIGMFQACEPIEIKSNEVLPPNEMRVLIELKNGDPLLVEHRVGKGRIMTLFTTATPQQESLAWSNLATLPIFPVIVNEIGGWLAQANSAPFIVTAGSIALPDPSVKTWKLARRADTSQWETLRDETDTTAKPILESDVYRVTSTNAAGESSQRAHYFSVNPDPVEGDLAKLSKSELSRIFGSMATIVSAESLFLDSDNERSWRPMHLAAMLLLGLLIFERFLATRCSHIQAVPPLTRGVAR